MMPLYIALGVIALIVIYLIALYNGLVAKRQQCNESFSGIDVQLKLRQNLVPNLVDTVKGYASHEQETLDQVISARNSAIAANGPAEASAAEGMLSGALGKLFALSEAYPDLKANTNFLQLQNELSQIEDKIAAARRFYNSAVGDFNTAIEQFPAVMLAGGWGFSKREFFDLGEETRADLSVVPEVKF
ncbi:LemA family protein [Hirschia baltica]|uniref:LemA family protein n=1 Tax=Hirschia baltica (strain ATCC 49814 / DSM 5838 / IFAM 1418) TaxID=582402 RepID=C6XIU4_HIRBI|nr:LemA family protein [Hirschia baltica]ACT59039.1 LemA family protein [Hirschia baltica ATCC 49814]